MLLEFGKAGFLIAMAVIEDGEDDLKRSIGFSVLMVLGSLRFILHVIDKKTIMMDFTRNRIGMR